MAYLAMFADSDPISYADVVRIAKWIKVMDSEIEAIKNK